MQGRRIDIGLTKAHLQHLLLLLGNMERLLKCRNLLVQAVEFLGRHLCTQSYSKLLIHLLKAFNFGAGSVQGFHIDGGMLLTGKEGCFEFTDALPVLQHQ